MKLVFALCALAAAPVTVEGFGGAQGQSCHACACSNSFGDILDPLNNRKCCSPQLWDSFCDSLTETLCEKECAGHDHSNDEEDWLVAFKSASDHSSALGQQGAFCGKMYSASKECAPEFHCHSKDENEDPEDGVCMPFHEVGEELVDEVPYLRNFTIIPTGENQDFRFTVQQALGTTKNSEDMLADIARSMNVDSSRLYLVEVPGRRQYNNYYTPYTYGVSGTTGSQSCPQMSTTKASSAGVQWAGQLTAAGVKLLNFDWDLTANTKHTYQESYSSYEQIACYVSSDFINLALAYCEQNLPVAIVTYNDATLYVAGRPVNGKVMIEKVLKMVFPNNSKCANMNVYARNDHSRGTGKNWHLQESQKAHGYPSNRQTVLVDDTKTNIDIAGRSGYQTVYVNPAAGFTFSNMQNYWKK